MKLTEKRSIEALLKTLEQSFDEVLTILKAIGNDKRLKILLSLLTGEKSFDTLKKETDLQKTALSNHLTALINTFLIEKPDYGKYKITADGKLFIRALETAYAKSEMWKKKQTETAQKGQFSDRFVESFFRRG